MWLILCRITFLRTVGSRVGIYPIAPWFTTASTRSALTMPAQSTVNTNGDIGTELMAFWQGQCVCSLPTSAYDNKCQASTLSARRGRKTHPALGVGGFVFSEEVEEVVFVFVVPCSSLKQVLVHLIMSVYKGVTSACSRDRGKWLDVQSMIPPSSSVLASKSSYTT